MEVRFHRSVDEFRALAQPLYHRDPVVHTIELTLLQTPPSPLSCSAIPREVVDQVAARVAVARPGLIGVRGGRDTAHAFAEV